MRVYVTSLVVAGSLAALTIVVLRTTNANLTMSPAVSTFHRDEVARVRAHFDSVLAESTLS